MNQLEIRPSGSAVLLNAAVKVFPSEEEALAVVDRHKALPSALPVIHHDGRTVVYPMAMVLPYISPDVFLETLAKLHSTESGYTGTRLSAYIAYCTRDKSLPSAFSADLKSLYHMEGNRQPNAKTVHGDANVTNVVLYNNELHWIDLSVRPEPLYRELDVAKYYFNELRCGRLNAVPDVSELTIMFLLSHFCRVWTRESPEERLVLEELYRRVIG